MIDPLVGSIIVILVLLGLVFASTFVKHRPKMLDVTYFQNAWTEAQTYCKDATTWPLAIINADKLLDEALKRRRFRGKTMGERMVSAQREMSDNDGVWYAHKLRNRLVHEADVKLREPDVKKAMLGIRQALKDLGVSVK